MNDEMNGFEGLGGGEGEHGVGANVDEHGVSGQNKGAVTQQGEDKGGGEGGKGGKGGGRPGGQGQPPEKPPKDNAYDNAGLEDNFGRAETGEHFGSGDDEGHFGGDTGDAYSGGGYEAEEADAYAQQGGIGGGAEGDGGNKEEDKGFKDGVHSNEFDTNPYAGLNKNPHEAGQDEDPDTSPDEMNGFEGWGDPDEWNPTAKKDEEKKKEEAGGKDDKKKGKPSEEESDEANQAAAAKANEKIANDKDKGPLPPFNMEFIKKNYYRLRWKADLKASFDQLNIQVGTAISSGCMTFDYLMVVRKLKYAKPNRKLDAIVELFFLEQSVFSCLFQPIVNMLDKVLNFPAVKVITEQIMKKAREAGYV